MANVERVDRIADDAAWVDELEDLTCWALLSHSALGRIGFVDDGEPRILPVNFRAVDRSILFRTGLQTALHDLAGRTVEFEVDDSDSNLETGWSVVVHGQVEEITDPAGLRLVAELGVHPWAPGARDQWMRIVPTAVTGRAISRPSHRPQSR